MIPLIQTSAPGKLLLMGEHAVLEGFPALVCAVNRRLTVTLARPSHSQVQIHSALGKDSQKIDAPFVIQPPFEFVWATLERYRCYLPHGLDIHIQSEFSDQVGLGSSSAVTAATLLALRKWLGQELSPEALFQEALEIVRLLQKSASGTDLVAAIWGGLSLFRPQPFQVTPLLTQTQAIKNLHLPQSQANPLSRSRLDEAHESAADADIPLKVFYMGYKTRTAQVISQVQERFKHERAAYLVLCQQTAHYVEEATLAIKNSNWPKLGQLFKKAQVILDQMGVSDKRMNQRLKELNEDPGLMGAKQSGSGLGDCLIALGQPLFSHPLEQSVQIDLKGVKCHAKII